VTCSWVGGRACAFARVRSRGARVCLEHAGGGERVGMQGAVLTRHLAVAADVPQLLSAPCALCTVWRIFLHHCANSCASRLTDASCGAPRADLRPHRTCAGPGASLRGAGGPVLPGGARRLARQRQEHPRACRAAAGRLRFSLTQAAACCVSAARRMRQGHCTASRAGRECAR